MKTFYSFNKWLALPAIVASMVLPSSVQAQQTNFDEVGKQMSFLLRNVHYAKMKFDATLSKRFLKHYLDSLDPGRYYFTELDLVELEKKHGQDLALRVAQGRSFDVAKEIYDLYEQRFEQRFKQAKDLLAKNDFDFSRNDDTSRIRKHTTRAKDEADAAAQWEKQIAQQVLSETIRRENLARLAKEQGKEDPSVKEEPVSKVIERRLERLYRESSEADDEEIANYFLTALAECFDPHTDYFSARELDRFKSQMSQTLIGVGALLQEEDDGAVKIRGIVLGGPLDKQGQMQLGDRILAVDSDNEGPKPMVDIMFMRIDRVIELIRGAKGTQVKMKVEPAAGGEVKFVVIQREEVAMKDELAKGEIIDMKREDGTKVRLGFISFPSFYADFETGKTQVSEDVERILSRMVIEKIDGLVLDLRGNGGGSLQEVKQMSGFFTGPGPVVQIRDTRGTTKVLSGEDPAIYLGPMVVLTDAVSASASEILAGVLQDNHRAVIVGDESTYGKGTVQQPFELAEWMAVMESRERAGALKATIQKFYRVAGGSTQLKGVESDIVIPSALSALELGEKHMDYAMEWDEIKAAPGFRPMDPKNLHLDKLKSLSEARLKEMKDLNYLKEDIQRTKDQIKENKLSLNKEKRIQEARENESRIKARNQERRARYEQQVKEDKERMTVYRLKLDDVDKKVLEVLDPEKEKNSYMKQQKSEVDDLDDSPEFPSGLDPVKRESFRILTDLIDLQTGKPVKGVVLGQQF